MNLVEEVKRAYSLNDKELCELETGIERMELERQMSHDTLDLLMEKVRRVFVRNLHCVQSRKLKNRHGARNRFQEPSLELTSQAT